LATFAARNALKKAVMNSVVIISNPSEVGAGTRGSSLGIGALRVAGWKKNSDLFKRFVPIDIPVNNDALYTEDRNPYAHRIAAICRVFERTAEYMNPEIERGNFPIVIGGDHSVAAGTISALRKAAPNSRLGVIWIDAHADLHTPYTTPSGNFHGMPLAIALGEDNIEVKKNQPVPDTIEEWNGVKALWGINPKVHAEDLILFGVRDTEDEEKALIARRGIRNFDVQEVRLRGIVTCILEAVEQLKNCDQVYISFDVDSMDPALTSDGTGTPVQGGFSKEESMELITRLFEHLPIVCFEMVEINPALDTLGNKMAEVAFDILSHVVDLATHKA
jgi:arginase